MRRARRGRPNLQLDRDTRVACEALAEGPIAPFVKVFRLDRYQEPRGRAEAKARRGRGSSPEPERPASSPPAGPRPPPTRRLARCGGAGARRRAGPARFFSSMSSASH